MGVLEGGSAIRIVQELPGHRDATTTMSYTHVPNRGRLAVESPVDRLLGAAALPEQVAIGIVGDRSAGQPTGPGQVHDQSGACVRTFR